MASKHLYCDIICVPFFPGLFCWWGLNFSLQVQLQSLEAFLLKTFENLLFPLLAVIMKELVCDYRTKEVTVDGRKLEVGLCTVNLNIFNLEYSTIFLSLFFSSKFNTFVVYSLFHKLIWVILILIYVWLSCETHSV